MSIILVYSLIVLAIFRFRNVPIFRFDFLYTIMTAFGALIGTLPLVTYLTDLSLFVAAFIILTHASIVLGFGLNARFQRNGIVPKMDDRGQLIRFLALFTIAFIFLKLSFLIAIFELPILSKISSLGVLRSSHSFTEASGGLVERLIDALSHFAFTFVILTPLFLKKSSKQNLILAGIAFVLLVDHSLAVGARGLIVFMLISTLAVYSRYFEIQVSRSLFLFALALVTIYFLASQFYLVRNDYFSASPNFFISHNCAGGQMGDAFSNSLASVQATILSLCYFSSPPHFFQLFIDSTDWYWQHSLGQYNLSFVFPSTFSETREQLALLYDKLEVGTNPWSTFTRDLFIDFGYFLLVPAFFLGWFLRITLRKLSPKDPLHSLRFGILAGMGFMAPFISPLILRPLLYPLLITLFLPLVIKQFSKPSAIR